MKTKYLLSYIILLLFSFSTYAQPEIKPISINNPKPPTRNEIKKLAYIISRSLKSI